MVRAPQPLAKVTYLKARLDRIEPKKYVVLLHVTDTDFEHRILRIFNHQLDFFRDRIGMGVLGIGVQLHWYIEADNQVRSFSFTNRNSGWHVLS